MDSDADATEIGMVANGRQLGIRGARPKVTDARERYKGRNGWMKGFTRRLGPRAGDRNSYISSSESYPASLADAGDRRLAALRGSSTPKGGPYGTTPEDPQGPHDAGPPPAPPRRRRPRRRPGGNRPPLRGRPTPTATPPGGSSWLFGQNTHGHGHSTNAIENKIVRTIKEINLTKLLDLELFKVDHKPQTRSETRRSGGLVIDWIEKRGILIRMSTPDHRLGLGGSASSSPSHPSTSAEAMGAPTGRRQRVRVPVRRRETMRRIGMQRCFFFLRSEYI